MSSVPTYRFGRFQVLPERRSVLVDGRPASLGARAFDMLVALIERRDRVVGGNELFDLIWPGLVVEENNLRQQVAALRRLLGVEAIVTVAGRGYRFALRVDDEQPNAPDASRSDAAAPGGCAGVPNNLPLNLPALIGREAALETVVNLLARTRLLTLVGAGGVGKTRLALEVADTLRSVYKDGVWFVELAPVADPAFVPRTVASALGVHEEPGRPLHDTLLDILRRRELLIVLDNCEHVVEACARWAEEVMHASAGTRTLATSREALGIAGETAWRVPSLRTADPNANPAEEELMGYAATQMFVQRAVAASPTFCLSQANAAAVASICHQLDGIPLALELAAARLKAMRVEQVAERLRDRFTLLTRGSRTALQRHQTLRSLIDWSHELLSEPERVLMRRVSVFAGGWTLEAAEAVCSGDGLATEEVLDLLTHLVEKSLVGLDDQSDRTALPDARDDPPVRAREAARLPARPTQCVRATSGHLVDFAESIRTAADRRRRGVAMAMSGPMPNWTTSALR